MSVDAEQWASDTFGRCELGDRRRTRRLEKLGAMLARQVGTAPSRACGGDEAAHEGAYRLIRNEAVDPAAIAEGGFAATAEAARKCALLLAVEDTTSLSYGHAVAEQLGDLGGPAHTQMRGFLVHSTVLVDAHSGHTVGLIEQQRWCRDPQERGQSHERGKRAYEDKESVKWEQASQRMSERLGETMARVISVCDRESDVFEYLKFKCEVRQHYLIRAGQNRRVEDEEHRRLFEALREEPVLGTHQVKLAQRGSGKARKARQARLELRARRVELRAPQRDGSLGALQVNAVLAQEKAPPRGEEPASWLLLTSEPVDDLEAVRNVVRYYALRWRVEEFHKAWKSGAGVERRRMQTPENLERIAVILSFVAVRLLQLREALDDTPHANEKQRPCTEILSRDEWRILWVSQRRTKPPRKTPTLRWAYEAIAKLGGWTDSKRTGRAGWDTMWHGWFRFQERLDAYLLTREML